MSSHGPAPSPQPRPAIGWLVIVLCLAASNCITVTTGADLAAARPPAPTATPTPAPATPTATPPPTPTPLVRTAPVNAEAAARLIMPRPAAFQTVSRRPAVQRLAIPRIGLDTRVLELGIKTDEHGQAVWETAAFAAGHHRGTAQPGEPGNIVISGHISSRAEGAVFRRLPELRAGDGIVLSTADRDYLYRVSETAVVDPSAVEVMAPTDDERLTLITCVPDGVYTHRLIVTARRAQ